MSSSSRVILVTGANQGIGFEIVRQLAQAGHTTYLGARNVQRGKEAVQKLEKEGLKSVHFVQLDVTSDSSVEAAAKKISSEQSHLDVLVNNAGIAPDLSKRPSEVEVDLIKTVYETNVFGAMRVTSAFLPLLKRSSNPVILNVSSGLGSLTKQSKMDGSNPHEKAQLAGYNSSKAALNAYTITLAHDLKDFRVNTISPGLVATNLNGYLEGTPYINYAISPVEAAAGVIKTGILLERDGPTCQFLDYTGGKWEW